VSGMRGSSQSVPHSSSDRIEGALSRREFLVRGGALVVSFSMARGALGAQPQEPQNVGKEPKQAPPLPGSLKNAPLLDSWIRIDADGTITVFSGKAELGQGIKTALIQVAAEELAVEPRTINLVTADTSRTPNEGYTAGSQSMSDGATAIQHAAAQVRAILAGIAAQRLNVPLSDLTVHLGAVRAKDGRSLRFGELVTGEALHVQAAPQSPLRDPKTRGVMGKSLPRVDIPSKVAGRPSYVHDLRLPNMVHARVVRPPGYGARLQTVDTSSAEKMPGVLKIVRNGSFLAVVAEREYQAIVAMRALARTAQWSESRELPRAADAYDHFQKLPQEVYVDAGGAADVATGPGTISATYRRPYQMHASIGPSCAVALAEQGTLTVWSHTQGAYPLRNAIAEMLRMPAERIRCIHMEGSGCYGHNGADDAAADAALIANAFPGRPVRVQWMREDEHTWEPYGSMMIGTARAARRSQRHRVAIRSVEQHAQRASRPCRKSFHCVADRHAVHAAAAETRATAGRGRQSQRHPHIQLSEHACRSSLRARDAASRVRAAWTRRVRKRVRDRKLHGRARGGRKNRSAGLQAASSRRCACSGRDQRGGRAFRLGPLPEAAWAWAWLRLCALQELRRVLRCRDRSRSRP